MGKAGPDILGAELVELKKLLWRGAPSAYQDWGM